MYRRQRGLSAPKVAIMEGMPVYVRALRDSRLVTAREVFGTELRYAVLAYLVEHGPARRGEIYDGIVGVSNVSETALKRTLETLLEAKVITYAPRPGQRQVGRHRLYRIAPKRLEQLWQVFGSGLGLHAVKPAAGENP